MNNSNSRFEIAVVLKGYPRLSETFIAQELKALEDHNFTLHIFSLRNPTDKTIHPIHNEIQANISYLPEYIHFQPIRIIRSFWKMRNNKHLGKAVKLWYQDLKRDLTRNRIRRFAQAIVMAAEFPQSCNKIYAHFMHTPGSVARYASILLGKPWGFSAHAKDIWTLAEWEKRQKLDSASFAVTCTQANLNHLQELASKPNVKRVYHGLDFNRFPDPGEKLLNSASIPSEPVTILSVGRAVSKKGYPVLLQALATLNENVPWQLIHIGGGKDSKALQQLAIELEISEKINWKGALSQDQVLKAYQQSDIFVIASVIDPDGDRDGLPNVLMEAQSQRLCCVATSVSGIPELIKHNETGLLVESGSSDQLAEALNLVITDPDIRLQLANAGFEYVRKNFSQDKEISTLISQLDTM